MKSLSWRSPLAGTMNQIADSMPGMLGSEETNVGQLQRRRHSGKNGIYFDFYAKRPTTIRKNNVRQVPIFSGINCFLKLFITKIIKFVMYPSETVRIWMRNRILTKTNFSSSSGDGEIYEIRIHQDSPPAKTGGLQLPKTDEH